MLTLKSYTRSENAALTRTEIEQISQLDIQYAGLSESASGFYSEATDMVIVKDETNRVVAKMEYLLECVGERDVTSAFLTWLVAIHGFGRPAFAQFSAFLHGRGVRRLSLNCHLNWSESSDTAARRFNFFIGQEFRVVRVTFPRSEGIGESDTVVSFTKEFEE